MRFTADRPYSDPETAARKLLEIANAAEVMQDGRIHIESTRHFCIGKAQRQPNTRLAWTWRSPAAVWCFTRAARSSGSGRRAPICSLDSLQAPDYLAIKGLTRTARDANAERIRA